MTRKFGILLSLFLPLTSVTAATFSRSSVREMCLTAEAIIVGKVIEGDKVEVERWIRPDPASQTLPATIEIYGLSQHVRENGPPHYSRQEGTREKLPLNRFVAFLEKKSGSWECLTTDDCGSLGLIWILDGKCFAYTQYTSWGPYYLFPVGEIAPAVQDNPYRDWLEPVATEALLMAEIDAGLKDAREWSDVLAEPDKRRQASRLAAYYFPSTSPVGARKTFILRIEKPMVELDNDAVPALVEALKSRQPNDRTEEILRTLIRINANTEAAIPELSKLLGHPLLQPPAYVIHGLSRTENPRIALPLTPFLLSPYEDVRKNAAAAVEAIVPEGLSLAELIQQSPIIAVVKLFRSDSLIASAKSDPSFQPKAFVFTLWELKGSLPKRTIIGVPTDPLNPDQRAWPSEMDALVFLRQDEQGRYVPTTGESIKRYQRNTGRVFWPRDKGVPLETIKAAIR